MRKGLLGPGMGIAAGVHLGGAARHAPKHSAKGRSVSHQACRAAGLAGILQGNWAARSRGHAGRGLALRAPDLQDRARRPCILSCSPLQQLPAPSNTHKHPPPPEHTHARTYTHLYNRACVRRAHLAGLFLPLSELLCLLSLRHCERSLLCCTCHRLLLCTLPCSGHAAGLGKGGEWGP